MLKVDPKILNKKGELSERWEKRDKKHIEYGIEMARKSRKGSRRYNKISPWKNWWKRISQKGKKGNEIPELARVVAIADIYAILTEDRHYREKYDYCDAMKIVMQSSIKLVDVNILKSLNICLYIQ